MVVKISNEKIQDFTKITVMHKVSVLLGGEVANGTQWALEMQRKTP